MCEGDGTAISRISLPFAAVTPPFTQAGLADSLELEQLPTYARTHREADETLACVFAEMLRVPLLAQSVCRETLALDALCRKRFARSFRVLFDSEPAKVDDTFYTALYCYI